MEVALGHLAKFTCEIQSAPNVRFQWFKAGREIYESDKCSIRSAHYVSTLEILRTQVVDCGEYTCRASNEYGSASCTATLTVTGKCHTPTRMFQSHFIVLPVLLFVQVQNALVLPTGEPNSQSGNMGRRNCRTDVDRQSLLADIFLTAAKENIQIIYYLENHVKAADEQWFLKLWFWDFCFCFVLFLFFK